MNIIFIATIIIFISFPYHMKIISMISHLSLDIVNIYFQMTNIDNKIYNIHQVDIKHEVYSYYLNHAHIIYYQFLLTSNVLLMDKS